MKPFSFFDTKGFLKNCLVFFNDYLLILKNAEIKGIFLYCLLIKSKMTKVIVI